MPDHRPPAPVRASRRHLLTVAGLALPASALTYGPGQAAFADRPRGHGDGGVGAQGGDAATVLTWHDLTAQVVAAAAFPEPVTQSRAWAVSWLAAARATAGDRSGDHSTAGFVQALHDTLVALVPGQQALLDAALTNALARVPAGSEKQRGVADGASAASRTLAERSGDGLDTASVDVAYTPPPPAPGVFQPTPPTSRPVIRAGQGRARPFLLRSNDQFDPGAPYGLDSRAYAADLAEVRGIGATGSPRTAEQTEVAQFWYPALNFAYVQSTRAVVAGTPRGSIAELARLVAAFNVITTDAQIAVYDAKFTYLFWRPSTAITTGSQQPDPAWTSYQVAPQHPEYPSGHGGQIGSQQTVLETLVGRRTSAPVTLTSSTAPGVSRSYGDWATMTREVVDARVWEGVHFRTSDVVGVQVGQRLAAWELGQLSRLGI